MKVAAWAIVPPENTTKWSFKIHKHSLSSLLIRLCFEKLSTAAHFNYTIFYLIKNRLLLQFLSTGFAPGKYILALKPLS